MSDLDPATLPPTPPIDRSFNNMLQVRGGKGLAAPEWYHPERDLANRFPNWVRDSLLRISNPSTPLPEPVATEVGNAAQALGALVRAIAAGKYDGLENREKLYNDLGILSTMYPRAYSLIAAVHFETELFRFRDWAPDVRQRSETRTPMPTELKKDCPKAERAPECANGESGS